MFAEGYTGLAATNGRATFTEVLSAVNPWNQTVPLTFTYLVVGRKAPIVVTHVLAPMAAMRELVNSDIGSNKEVSAVVSSARRLIVSRTILRQSLTGGHLDGSTTPGAGTPSTSWYFAEGYTGQSFQEYLLLFNPSAATAAVTIVLAPQAPSTKGARVATQYVQPLSRATVNIGTLNRGGPAQGVGMIVTSTVALVAERVEYYGAGSGSGKFGTIVALGSRAPVTSSNYALGSFSTPTGTSVPSGSGGVMRASSVSAEKAAR